ncbi:MAG: hypothetical protein VX320_02725 [Candidatus Thermoplasmatota archaeon]|nr:hypothetical protein [Candidatus Thermoplasmatota archaeon]
MHTNRKFSLSLLLTFMMISVPWASADISQWMGPDRIASGGQTVTLDGWQVPGNATILDSWMTVEDEMVYANNGSEWRVDTSHNFSVGQFTDSTMDHFNGRLSLEPDDAVSQVDSFNGVAQITFNNWPEFGNTSIWEPGLPSLVTNGTRVGQTRQMSYGNIPATAPSGSIIAATLMDGAVPGGEVAAIRTPSIALPAPIIDFNLTINNWRHTGPDDAVWVEYKLDNGPWTWLEPVGGYNANTTLSATASPNGTPNNSTTFPAWTNVNATGWNTDVFNLDNITGINTSVAIKFRFRISTDTNSPGRPGWFLDDVEVTNVGGSSGYWHHGCYVVTGTCAYSNNAVGLLEGQFDLSNAGTGSEVQVRLEWDLEGSGWDNFCVELSSNGNTWTDISTGTSGGGTASGSTSVDCRSRSGSIPNNGYTLNGVTYGDETNGFVLLELPIPTAFQNSGMTDLRIRVDTDSSVTYGGTVDGQEGVTVDRISIVAANGSILDNDPLSSAASMTDSAGSTTSGIQGVNDWNYISIGAGALTQTFDFEDSQATAPTTMPDGWSAVDDWEYGPLGTTSMGPLTWPSGPFGLGTNLAGSAQDAQNDHLYSPPYTIPAGASARLTFEHWMCADVGYGGGAVFISTDNNTWTHFDPGNNWYDTTAYTWGSTGTLLNLGIFDGSNIVSTTFGCNGPRDMWATKVADLSSYSGQTVWFRYTFEPGPYTWSSDEGWYIDDVGLEVDYFLEEGDWISDVLQLDNIGNGFVDIDGMVPEDTWATGTILDAAGNPVDGFANLSFPISLHGLDRDVYPGGIRIQVNMGTDDPFLTPLIDAIHVGSVRTFDARGAGNGWNINSNLDLWGSNLTNNGSAVLQINAPFVHSSRPVTAVQFSGAGSQVTLRAIDAAGNAIGTSGVTGTIQFPEPQPGFGVRIEVNPGGRISSLWAEGNFAQPALNPVVDVTSDGTTDWSFPHAPYYGNHGWQTLFYQSTDASGTTTHSSDQSTSVSLTPASGASISTLIPGDATITSAALSMMSATGFNAPVELSIGSATLSFTGDGVVTQTLPASIIAQMNMQSAQSGLQTNRDWRVIEFDLSSTVADSVDITAISIGYSISENVTSLTQQMIDYHAVEIAPGNVDSVNIPLSYTADKGAVAIDGGIYHELMITNYPFAVPGTMYPDGQVIEITTRHQHLYDNDEISKIVLTGFGSDGSIIEFEVTNPTGNAVFSQLSGANQLPMEMDCSVSEIGNILNVDWRFKVSWTWDDVGSIAWSALAFNMTGDGIAPATALSGGQGSQAIENDLEISGFIVRNSDGYDISNRFSPEYPFHVRSGDTVDVSGTVRFQNTIDTRPIQSDFAMIVNDSGIEQSLVVDGDGTYSGTLTISGGDNHTLFPSISRVGPVTGATGANDTTISPPTIEVLMDDMAPIAGQLLVSTSVGLLDANGYVWDPINSLTVYVTVSDEEDRDSEITLNYWREGYDDGNGDGVAQADEYQTMVESLFTLRSGSQQVTFAGIPVASNGFNGKVSLWISGTDWAGNSYQDGGTGGAPGLDNDWATLQTAENTETYLQNTGFSIDSTNDYLLAGQTHTISMTVVDQNGVSTLDDIGVYLAGQLHAPLGEMHYDPRQDLLTTVGGSYVTPISASVTQLSSDTAEVSITFSVSWDMPPSESYRVPGITIMDDMQVVTNVNNIQAIHWKLDNDLRAVVTRLGDLTPPHSTDSDSHLYVRQGDEVSIEGIVVYDATNVTLETPSENLSIFVDIPYGGPDGTPIHRTVSVQQGGSFTTVVLLPASRAPFTPSMPIELSVLELPGLATATLNSDTTLTVDSVAPEVQFSVQFYPLSSLVLLESDRLDQVVIDILIREEGGFPTTPLNIEWTFLRSTGAEYMGYGSSSVMEFVRINDEGDYHFSGTFNMRPSNGAALVEGDYMAVWFSGEDFSGNALVGTGTESDPRYPSLNIIEFNPKLSDWEITPLKPDYGEIVTIELNFENEGLRTGTINVSMVEDLEGNWRNVGDAVEITLGPKKKNVKATFEWEAWKEGEAQLYVVVDGDTDNSMPIDKFEVELVESKSVDSSTLLLAGVSAFLAIVVVILLLIVIRRPSDSTHEYDEADDVWFDDEGNQIREQNGIRLDYEDETLSNAASRHGIFDKMAFLQHAQQYDRDNDGYLDAAELDRAAVDFLAMLSQQMVTVEASYPLDFNNETIQAIIAQYGIHDRQAFLAHASNYDSDQNGYLKKSELDLAASDYISGGYNQPPPQDPRVLAIAEVRAALPDWTESKVAAWMDKGWSASQIIEHNAPQLAPAAPVGFGDEYTATTQVESQPEPEPEPVEEVTETVEVEIIEQVAEELPSEGALKKMKKAELVELAETRNLESTGTKADIISRLLG